jgi:hypothetical protein
MLPSPYPFQKSASKSLFLGGAGNKITLTCFLHRPTWVAGQACWISIRVTNDTSRRVKKLTIALWRQTTVFRISPQSTPGGSASSKSMRKPILDVYDGSTTRKCVSESALEAGHKSSKGLVTAKGWWIGVEPRSGGEVTYSVPIPVSCFSCAGRHIFILFRILSRTRSQSLEVGFSRSSISFGLLFSQVRL